MSVVITIKVDKRISELIEKMISLGIAKTKNEAVNLLIEYGRNEIEKWINKEEKVEELINKWLKDGFPYKGLDTSDLREERV
ncbi:VapB-type antitoxin [Saccharolobus solfataricus]|jgi:hypothetical protein|uniref:VapB-type antitoxin n=7 Tax=Saccharolobus TaxID=2100760 RepID=A0A0E3MDP7_SACSO|nr:MULTISPECIES: hypothetical protein [Sulfolobaceae]ACP54920.1 conserved hypothetical protein [Sulfolobus islandicus M.16.27]ADX81806.1 VapB-type antitoxin [Sulfolobus islandicus HVE10/4]ADX84824.1 VapB-type antitoxin [Sulfolobus islandicus REY15A]AGJ62366.1 VapB-like protein [Sulfolobus islandicus LAL14/1]AKA74813.1 VapB-type antitoxin [Saccharolobus solfataricus]